MVETSLKRHTTGERWEGCHFTLTILCVYSLAFPTDNVACVVLDFVGSEKWGSAEPTGGFFGSLFGKK